MLPGAKLTHYVIKLDGVLVECPTKIIVTIIVLTS